MSSVLVLAEAAEDLEQARDFYDAQEPGVVITAPIRWCPTSPAWRFTTEFTRVTTDFIGCSPIGFLSEFTIVKPKLKPRCLPCWICAAIPIGFAKN